MQSSVVFYNYYAVVDFPLSFICLLLKGRLLLLCKYATYKVYNQVALNCMFPATKITS